MNTIYLSGDIKKEPAFSHEFMGENFYTFQVETKRNSGNCDVLNCVMAESYLHMISSSRIRLIGEIRTRNVRKGKNKKLELIIFVKEFIEECETEENITEMQGYVCKPPIYRQTPLGRKITNILIACVRENQKRTDYIPCIFWGRNALRVANMEVGQELKIFGRMQSRDYVKKNEDGSEENNVAYELSVSRIEVAE